MPGDRVSGRPSYHPQESEMVQETPGMAEAVSAAEKRSGVTLILAGIDEELFALQFIAWIGEIIETRGIHLVIDGKALRAAMEKVKNFRTPMVMNAIDAATGLVLAQLPLQNKECEITAIPELLKVLDIRDSTVTLDAIGTQTEIMGQIIRQGGHFVLTVKRNQQ